MEPTRISVAGLKKMLDQDKPVYIIDTRSPAAWSDSEVKLPGAVRIHYSELENHLKELPRDRTIVTYCT